MAEKKKQTKRNRKDPGFLPGMAAGSFVLVMWGVVAFQPDGAAPARAAETAPEPVVAPEPAEEPAPPPSHEVLPAVPSWKQDERWKRAGELGEAAIDRIDAANEYHEKKGDPFRLAGEISKSKEQFEEAFALLEDLAADYSDNQAALRQIETRRKRFEKKLRHPRR